MDTYVRNVNCNSVRALDSRSRIRPSSFALYRGAVIVMHCTLSDIVLYLDTIRHLPDVLRMFISYLLNKLKSYLEKYVRTICSTKRIVPLKLWLNLCILNGKRWERIKSSILCLELAMPERYKIICL